MSARRVIVTIPSDVMCFSANRSADSCPSTGDLRSGRKKGNRGGNAFGERNVTFTGGVLLDFDTNPSVNRPFPDLEWIDARSDGLLPRLQRQSEHGEAQLGRQRAHAALRVRARALFRGIPDWELRAAIRLLDEVVDQHRVGGGAPRRIFVGSR